MHAAAVRLLFARRLDTGARSTIVKVNMSQMDISTFAKVETGRSGGSVATPS